MPQIRGAFRVRATHHRTLCEGMKRHSTGTILSSAFCALLLLATLASSGRMPEARPFAADQVRDTPVATLQSHEGRLPFVGAQGPALDLSAETQLRLPVRLGARLDGVAPEPAHLQAAQKHAARSWAAARRFADYVAALTHARQGIPSRHNTPPPFSIS